MTYNLKNVFYLGATDEYPASTYASGGIEGNIPIDVSAYVDPIAKGRQRGQGLAIYKVHCNVSGDNVGGPFAAADVGSAVIGLSVKPYATSGDNSSAIEMGDLSCDSDLLVWGAHAWAPAGSSQLSQARRRPWERCDWASNCPAARLAGVAGRSSGRLPPRGSKRAQVGASRGEAQGCWQKSTLPQ